MSTKTQVSCLKIFFVSLFLDFNKMTDIEKKRKRERLNFLCILDVPSFFVSWFSYSYGPSSSFINSFGELGILKLI